MKISAGDKKIQPIRILVWLIWTSQTIFEYVEEVIERIPGLSFIASAFFPTIFVALLIICLPSFMSSVKVKDFCFYAVAVLIVLVSCLVFKESSGYIKDSLFGTLCLTFPMFFIGLKYEHRETNKDIYYASVLGIIAVFAYQLYCLILDRELHTDNMNTAYIILPSVMYVIYWFFNHAKKSSFIWVLLGCILLIIFGTRGPLLIVVVYIFVEFYTKVIRHSRKQNKIIFYVFITLFAFVFFFTNIVSYFASLLGSLFSSLGFSDRIFSFLAEGNISFSNGRDVLYTNALKHISEHFIIGTGVFSDRVVLGNYVHNMVLELWIDFGVFIGTALFCWIVFIPIRALRRSREKERHFLLMLVCMVFLKLMLSGSYIEEPFLYFLLGYSLKISRAYKNAENAIK